jgi:hypothetical protein
MLSAARQPSIRSDQRFGAVSACVFRGWPIRPVGPLARHTGPAVGGEVRFVVLEIARIVRVGAAHRSLGLADLILCVRHVWSLPSRRRSI